MKNLKEYLSDKNNIFIVTNKIEDDRIRKLLSNNGFTWLGGEDYLEEDNFTLEDEYPVFYHPVEGTWGNYPQDVKTWEKDKKVVLNPIKVFTLLSLRAVQYLL
jgi:hypothetical protein